MINNKYVKKVKTKQFGVCNNCEDGYVYDKETGLMDQKHELVNRIDVAKTIIMLCDDCLKDLLQGLNNYAEANDNSEK